MQIKKLDNELIWHFGHVVVDYLLRTNGTTYKIWLGYCYFKKFKKNLNLGNKYTNFEDSKLDESKTLLYEITTKPNHYKRFSRGQIVKMFSIL